MTRFFVLALAALFFLGGCGHSGDGGSFDARFEAKKLPGVWEIVAYEVETERVVTEETRPNFKYCFTASRAYLDLDPESPGDSAEGWADYKVLGSLLVLDFVYGEKVLRLVELTDDRLVVKDNGMRISLRRIADNAEGDSPVLPVRKIPVRDFLSSITFR